MKLSALLRTLRYFAFCGKPNFDVSDKADRKESLLSVTVPKKPKD